MTILKHKKLSPVLWSGMLILMVVLLFSHTYNDIVITTLHGINFWEILFEGDFLQFYQLNITASGNPSFPVVQGCAYNILIYLAFAVWNIPLALLSAFTNVDVMNNVLCLVYAKLLPVAAMLATAWLLRKIIIYMGIPEEGHGILSYLYLSSALMISVVFIMAQYDLMGVFFQLLGFYFFLKDDRRKFVLFFGIAFCFKYFSLVIFLPLLFLAEKRLSTYIKYLLGMAIPVLLTKLPFVLAADSSQALSGELMSLSLIGHMLSLSSKLMNLFVVVYILILLGCYLYKKDDKFQATAVWVCFVSYAAFFGMCNAYPYWSVMMAPFLVLVIAISPCHLYPNIVLETVGLSALVFSNILRYIWCYFGNTMESMIMPILFPGANYDGSRIFRIISAVSGEGFLFVVANSVFIGAMTALAFIAYPRKGISFQDQWRNADDCCDVLIFRILTVTCLCLIPILSLFI